MNILPRNNVKIIFIAIISFCLGVIIGIAPGLDVKTITGAVATLITAFSGAFFAFRLNETREKKKEKQNNLGSANRAIFSLIRAYSYITGYNEKLINPYKDKPEAYIDIPPSLGAGSTEFKIDFDSISFLIPKGKTKILKELVNFEELFYYIIKVIKKRNQFHTDIVQPKLEEAGCSQYNPIMFEEIDKILGDRISNTLKKLTMDLIEIMEQGEKKSKSLIDGIYKTMKEIFPGEEIVYLDKSINSEDENPVGTQRSMKTVISKK